MNTKHTPGPWRIGDDKALVVAGPRGLHIARVATVGMPNSDANARLIAHAPDLLAALRMLIDEMEGCFDYTDSLDMNPVIRVSVARAQKLVADVLDNA